MVEKEVGDQIRKEIYERQEELRWEMSTGVGCAHRKLMDIGSDGSVLVDRNAC